MGASPQMARAFGFWRHLCARHGVLLPVFPGTVSTVATCLDLDSGEGDTDLADYLRFGGRRQLGIRFGNDFPDHVILNFIREGTIKNICIWVFARSAVGFADGGAVFAPNQTIGR